jgi:hypothetical protein
MLRDKVNNCPTKGCKNKSESKSFCSTCRSRKSRAADPIKYAYLNLKNRAKQRPKEFTIPLDEFRKWCKDNDFQPGRGDSVDRKENEHGYHIWNIQKLPLIDNIRKYYDYDRYKPVVDTDENPF